MHIPLGARLALQKYPVPKEIPLGARLAVQQWPLVVWWHRYQQRRQRHEEIMRALFSTALLDEPLHCRTLRISNRRRSI
jgi:hypothetical protein